MVIYNPTVDSVVTDFQKTGDGGHMLLSQITIDGTYKIHLRKTYVDGVDCQAEIDVTDEMEANNRIHYLTGLTTYPWDDIQVEDVTVVVRETFNFTEGNFFSEGVQYSIVTDLFTMMDEDSDCYSEFKCFGVIDEISQCSGHGNCTSSDFCECVSIKYFGHECGVHHCYDYMSNDTQVVCGGHGECVDHDQCVCPTNYTLEKDCSIWECFGKLKNDSVVCNGVYGNSELSRGLCTYHDHCECDGDYTASPSCDWDCYGKENWLNTSCGTHGVCISHDLCNCSSIRYFGPYCDSLNCEIENDCSGRGECLDDDVCRCNDDYEGLKCETHSCGGVDHSELEVTCSGHGRCIAPNQCNCSKEFEEDYKASEHLEYFGRDCEIRVGKQLVLATKSTFALYFEISEEQLGTYHLNNSDSSFECSKFIRVNREMTKGIIPKNKLHLGDQIVEPALDSLQTLFSSDCTLSKINEFSKFPSTTQFLMVDVSHVPHEEYLGVLDTLGGKIVINVYNQETQVVDMFPPYRYFEKTSRFTLKSYSKSLDSDTEHEMFWPAAETQLCKSKLHVSDVCIELFKCYERQTEDGKGNFEYFSVGFMPYTTENEYRYAKFYYNNEGECLNGKNFREYRSFSIVRCYGSPFGDNFLMYKKCSEEMLAFLFETEVLGYFLATTSPLQLSVLVSICVCCCFYSNCLLFCSRKILKKFGMWRERRKKVVPITASTTEDKFIIPELEDGSNGEESCSDSVDVGNDEDESDVNNDEKNVELDEFGKTDEKNSEEEDDNRGQSSSSSSSSSDTSEEKIEEQDDNIMEVELKCCEITSLKSFVLLKDHVNQLRVGHVVNNQLNDEQKEEEEGVEDDEQLICSAPKTDDFVVLSELFEDFEKDVITTDGHDKHPNDGGTTTSKEQVYLGENDNIPSFSVAGIENNTSRKKNVDEEMDELSLLGYVKKSITYLCCCCCWAFYPASYGCIFQVWLCEYLKCVGMIIVILFKEGVSLWFASSEFLTNEDVDQSNPEYIVLENVMNLCQYVILSSILIYLSILVVLILVYVGRFVSHPLKFSIAFGSLKEYSYFRIYKSIFLLWFICVNLFCYITKFAYTDENERQNQIGDPMFWFSIIFPEMLLISSLWDVLAYNGVSSYAHLERLRRLGCLKGILKFPNVQISWGKVTKDPDVILEEFFQLIYLVELGDETMDEGRIREIGREMIENLSSSNEYGHLSWEMLDGLSIDEILYLKRFFFPKELVKENYMTIINHHRIASWKWILTLLLFPCLCYFGF